MDSVQPTTADNDSSMDFEEGEVCSASDDDESSRSRSNSPVSDTLVLFAEEDPELSLPPAADQVYLTPPKDHRSPQPPSPPPPSPPARPSPPPPPPSEYPQQSPPLRPNSLAFSTHNDAEREPERTPRPERTRSAIAFPTRTSRFKRRLRRDRNKKRLFLRRFPAKRQTRNRGQLGTGGAVDDFVVFTSTDKGFTLSDGKTRHSVELDEGLSGWKERLVCTINKFCHDNNNNNNFCWDSARKSTLKINVPDEKSHHRLSLATEMYKDKLQCFVWPERMGNACYDANIDHKKMAYRLLSKNYMG